MNGVRARRVRVRRVELALIEGPPHGPALVLLSGMLDLWTDYAPVLPQLIEHFHVVLVEHRGHGSSGWSTDGCYRVGDYADDLIAIIEEELRSPVCISGNSLGGLIALNVASRRPDLVRAIALEDVPLLVTESPVWASHWGYPFFVEVTALLKQWHANGADVEDLVQQIAALPLFRPRLDQDRVDRSEACRKLLEAMTSGGLLTEAEQSRIRRGWQRYLDGDRPTMGACWPIAVIRSLAHTWATVDPRVPVPAVDLTFSKGFDHLAALRAVRCPVLLWESDRVLSGYVTPSDIARVMAALEHVPHRHIVASGAGHHIHCDSPAMFVAETVGFFLFA